MIKKKITLYAVILEEDRGKPEEELYVQTIVTSKNEAYEYISLRYLMERQGHYTQWCELRGYDPNDIEKYWPLYFEDNLVDANDYAVLKMIYTIDDIASLLRVTGHCLPVGASYEKDIEMQWLENFIRNIKEVEENSSEIDSDKNEVYN